MCHKTTLCVRVTCDGCGAQATAPDGTPRHWPSLAEAAAELRDQDRWEAGRYGQRCPRCIAAVCAGRGHDWAPWASMRNLGEADLAIRVCGVCGRDEVAAACEVLSFSELTPSRWVS